MKRLLLVAPALVAVVALAGVLAPAASAKGTGIVAGKSQFGSMLFNSKRQAIYVFQSDRANKSACYGGCADIWPPVLTKGKPRALKGVRRSLLGTIRRDDGTTQVTYKKQPLYYYAHEGPGQVLCHNVSSYGGLWWVVAPSGRHR